MMVFEPAGIPNVRYCISRHSPLFYFDIFLSGESSFGSLFIFINLLSGGYDCYFDMIIRYSRYGLVLNYLGSFKASMPRVFVDGEIWYEIEKPRVVNQLLICLVQVWKRFFLWKSAPGEGMLRGYTMATTQVKIQLLLRSKNIHPVFSFINFVNYQIHMLWYSKSIIK